LPQKLAKAATGFPLVFSAFRLAPNMAGEMVVQRSAIRLFASCERKEEGGLRLRL